MHIDKYRTASGEYLLAIGEHYPTAEEFLYRGIMGFKGAVHTPMFAYIRAGLARIRAGQDCHACDARLATQDAEWDKAALELGLLEHLRSRAFFFFWADRQRLTRPGREIPLWLTITGQELLDDLVEMKV
jgi:hypothetical protein